MPKKCIKHGISYKLLVIENFLSPEPTKSRYLPSPSLYSQCSGYQPKCSCTVPILQIDENIMWLKVYGSALYILSRRMELRKGDVVKIRLGAVLPRLRCRYTGNQLQGHHLWLRSVFFLMDEGSGLGLRLRDISNNQTSRTWSHLCPFKTKTLSRQ